MAAVVPREFRLVVLGNNEVGKTSWCQRVSGTAFSRKPYARTQEAEAKEYLVELATSLGPVLLHLYDWAWFEKRRDVAEAAFFEAQVRRGPDAGVFLIDLTDRRTMRDFDDWEHVYSKAVGFDKPWIILGNKLEQKSVSVKPEEGKALARKGDHRMYVGMSLVDDTGVEDSVTAIARIMLNDLNVVVSKFGAASPELVKWSRDREAAKLAATEAAGPSGGAVAKARRVLLVVPSKALVEKFAEALQASEFEVEQAATAGAVEEAIADKQGLPVCAIMLPGTAKEGQQRDMKALAEQKGLPCFVTVPRDCLKAITDAIAAAAHK